MLILITKEIISLLQNGSPSFYSTSISHVLNNDTTNKRKSKFNFTTDE